MEQVHMLPRLNSHLISPPPKNAGICLESTFNHFHSEKEERVEIFLYKNAFCSAYAYVQRSHGQRVKAFHTMVVADVHFLNIWSKWKKNKENILLIILQT